MLTLQKLDMLNISHKQAISQVFPATHNLNPNQTYSRGRIFFPSFGERTSDELDGLLCGPLVWIPIGSPKLKGEFFLREVARVESFLGPNCECCTTHGKRIRSVFCHTVSLCRISSPDIHPKQLKRALLFI